MNFKELIIKVYGIGLISRKPKPIYVFLLFFAYLLIWIVAFTLYLKFEMTSLKLWVLILGILAFLTLIHAFLHRYVVKILGEEKQDKIEI